MLSPAKSLATACAQISARLPAALADGRAEPQRFIRVEAPLEGVAPLAWLAAQSHLTQYFWSDRDGHEEMAGVGEAIVLTPSGVLDLPSLFRRMRKSLPDHHPRLRYYGGFRFQMEANRGPRWQRFYAYRFVVPRFEVLKRGDRCILACNVLPGPAEDQPRLKEELQRAMGALRMTVAKLDAPLPPISGRVDAPGRKAWDSLIDKALEAFGANTLAKVVLARETTFKTAAPLDPVLLLAQLRQYTVRSFEFCFHPARDRAFIGATPERLYHRLNCFLESEAIAGTRRRGVSDGEDSRLGNELLHSEKDIHEHRLVVQSLRENLGKYCRAVQVADGPEFLRLRNVQHLYTTLEGVLEDNLVDAHLIDSLHPTPAVGGTPRDTAMTWIAAHEPFDRGIYAAPVGWVAYDEAEFAVAIRSALVQHDEISIYSGAGIVPGSMAEEEWDEIEAKMKNFLHALGR